MKWDFAIGNPAYQETQDETSDKPVYNYFLDEAFKVAGKVEMITPARFLFNAGKTPKAWNEKMLQDPHFKVSYFEQDSAKVFSNTDIKGGVAITYWDENRDFGAIGHFVTDEALRSVLYKVKAKTAEPLSSIVNSTEYFKISPRLYEEHPEFLTTMIVVNGKDVPLISKGHEFDLTSNILDKNPALFSVSRPKNEQQYYRVYGRANGQRAFKYINARYLQEREGLQKYKVILPESNNSGTFGETLVAPIVGDPDVATTQTFITMGFFDKRSEAEALLKYICTKFARSMLGTLKITQHNKRETWKHVPMQNFTDTSDINWNASIADIDQQLYKKYGLSQEEIDFIETHVKEMA